MKGQTTPIGVILVLAALTQLVNISHVEGIDQDFSNMLLEITTGNSTYPAEYTISQMQAGNWIVVNLTVPEEDYKLNVLSTAGSSYDSEYDPSILEISYIPGLSNDFSNLVIQFIDYNGNPEEISYTTVSKSDGNWIIIGLARPPMAGETISILAKVIELEDKEPELQPEDEPDPTPEPEPEGDTEDPEDPLIEGETGGNLTIAGFEFDGELEILDKEGKKIDKKLTSEYGNIKVVPKKGPLKKIIFKNLKSKNSFLRVDDVPENISAPEGVSWLSVYAIDPSALDFASATVTMVASGNSLYKCAAWDFDSRVCTDGNWKLIRTDLVPGQEYSLTITPDDPGFGEANLSVINVQSYPTVGGTWTVGFTTYGTADLRIRAVSGTTWSDSTDTEDLRLLNLMCGATPLSYTWESATNTAVYENYSCAQNGSETSRVLTPGKHYLEFSFGEDVDYAYNDACVNATDELFINNDTTICPGTFNVNDTSNDGLIKINASDLTLTCNNTVLDGDGTGYAIRVIGSQTNITVTGCNITDYDYGIGIQTDWDNGAITNNTFSEIDYYALYLIAATSNITVDSNSFYQDSTSGNILLYIYQSDYHTISNNYFQSTSDSGISVYSTATYNNITNNTFNITYTGQHAIRMHTSSTNNNIWRNTFYGRGIEVTDSWDGRTEARVANNNYCVNGIGNAYFDLLSYGLERPFGDCGPFPNISVISVNQSYDGAWTWNGTTSGSDVNLTSIQDAVANAPYGALVNVTTSTTQSDSIAAYFLDNVSLDCNNLATIDNDLTTGNGLDVRALNNFTVQNCSFDDFNYNIYTDSVYNSSFLNNTFSSAQTQGLFMFTSNNNLIDSNSFGGDPAGNYHIYADGPFHNNIISNNYFEGSDDYGIYFHHTDVTGNNVTGNIFNITAQHAIDLYDIASQNNNNFWKNTFYRRGFEITEDWNGRTQLRFNLSNFCVDDGSGAVGNAYLDGAGYERPMKDCGPFPNLTVVEVDPSYDNQFTWGGTTNGVTVNMSNIQDAVANVPAGGLVNVTASGIFPDSVYSWYNDNVTLECNNIATIDNDLTTGNGLDVRALNNFTAQNCSFDDFNYNIYTNSVYSSSFLNNTFSSAQAQGLFMFTSNSNLIDSNSFGGDPAGNYHIYADGPFHNNIISNNYFEGSDDYGIYFHHTDVTGNNVTGNIFNITAQHAIDLYDIASQNNNNFWKNTFYRRGFEITEDWNGRTQLRFNLSNFCVDDGSGAVGNAYLDGAGYERPMKDCGPFPNLTVVEVDPSYDNQFTWGGTTNGVTVNMSNIQDAVANVPAGGLVNVTASGIFPDSVYSWYNDNVTLECNNIATIDNDLTTGNGLDVRALNNFTAQNCSFDDFNYNIYTNSVYSSSFLNNTFSSAQAQGLFMFTSNSNLIDSNSFGGDPAGNYHIYADGPFHNNIISNNYFEGSNDIGLYFYYTDVTGNNVTGNIFNITAQHGINLYDIASQNNNNFWKNTFYRRGFEITEDWNGRTQLRFNLSNFCVDDGSGAVGNAYLDGAGYERPMKDCGPFPSLTTVEVDPSYDNQFTWGGTTNGVTVNMSNIQDAVANVPAGGLVNVTASGIFPDSVYSWYNDNVTLECNNIATIDNDLTTGNGLDVRALNNFTAQNCSFDDFNYNIYTNSVYSSSFLNNTFSSAQAQGLFMFTSNSNLIDSNSFGGDPAGNYHIYADGPFHNNIISNNYFEGSNDIGLYFYYTDVTGNNVTGNIFNITAQDAIRLYNTPTQNNNRIWGNDFIGRDADQIAVPGNNYFNNSNIGNYWRTYDSQSKGCDDLAPLDGVCDSPYEVESGTGVYDNHPQAHQFKVTPDCGEVVNSNLNLTGDLLNSTGAASCPQHGLIINASNIVVNGSGYAVNGRDSSQTYGIHAGAQSNVTIQNFLMDPYEYGILLNGTTTSIVENNTINDTAGAGILVINSANNNTLRNNTLIDNSVGLNITGATNTLVYYNNFTDSLVLQAYSDSATNLFNITNGTSCALCARGNYWSDIFSNAINISDSNTDDYGDTGEEYPYSSTDRGNVSSNIIDYGPWVGNYTAPEPAFPPIVQNVTLNTSLGGNQSSENLTLYYDVYDPNTGAVIKNITNWYEGGSSITALNMPFEANGDQNATDYSGYANHGNVTGATWNVTGGYDSWGAYTFDGSSDWYVTVENGTSIDFTSQDFTVMAWVYPRTTDAGMIYDNRYEIQGTDSGWMFGLYDNGAITFDINGDNDNAAERSDNNAYSANNWQHIAVVKEGTTQTYYVNGTSIGSDSVGTSSTIRYDPASHHLVGKVGDIYFNHQYSIPNRYFNGTIDELKVFSRPLSAEQIQAIFENKTDIIVSQETSSDETWSACVTPNDGVQNGAQNCSNNVSIEPNTLPLVENVTLNSTLGTNTTDENLTLYYDTYDGNNDSLKNITNWFLDGDPIAVLNLPFEVGSNSTWTEDYSSRGHNATVTGPTWSSSGGYDGFGAYTFDGTNDYMSLGTTTDLNLLSDYTIALWMYRTKSGYQGIFTKGSGSYAYLFAIDNANHLGYYNSGWFGSDSVVPADSWHHIAFVHNGDSATFYLDGQPDGTITTTTGQNVPTYSTEIGRWGGTYYLGATIDDLYFFNKSMSDEQIDALYQNRTDLIVSHETSTGDVWNACVTPFDLFGSGNESCSNNLTISSGAIPVLENITLNSTYGTNYSNENLTLYWDATDADNDSLYNTTNWYLNGTSIMVLNMPFEEGSTDSFAKDYSPFGNDVTSVTDNPDWGATYGSDGSGGFIFDGNDDLDLGDQSALTFATGEPFSVEFWINRSSTAAGYDYYLGKTSQGGWGNGYGFYSTSGNWSAINFMVGPYSTYFVGAPIQNNVWNHYVGVYNGSSIFIYHNGTLAANGSASASFASATYPFAIGSDGGSYFGTGSYDNVRVYNRSLTSDQVALLFQNNNHILHSSETLPGDNWSACVFTYDGVNEVQSCSGNLTVLGTANTLPIVENVTLNSTLGTNLTSENLTVYFDSYDADADSIKNITDWMVNGYSIAVLNMPFEADGGNNDTDYAGTDDSNTIVGSPVWNSTGGYDGRGAYQFGTASSYVLLTNESKFDLVNNMTVMAWIKPSVEFNSTTGTKSIVDKSDWSWTGWALSWRDAIDGLSLYLTTGTSDASADYVSTINPDTWYHVAGTFDGNTVSIYVDGQLRNTTNQSFTIGNGGSNVRIGSCPIIAGREFPGTIDDVMIFNRSLSAEQIALIYQNRTDVMHSNETSIGDVWQVCVTPNDGTTDGSQNCSNSLTILGATSDINSCQVISSNGTYVVAADLSGAPISAGYTSGDACIKINSSDVILDCNGYTLTGNQSTNSYGILIEAGTISNITVQNCDCCKLQPWYLYLLL